MKTSGAEGRFLRRYEEAIAAFSRAIEIDPSYPWALGSRGQTYRALGRYDEAIAAFVRPGDHVLVMSNGGFGGIHDKLLAALAAHAR